MKSKEAMAKDYVIAHQGQRLTADFVADTFLAGFEAGQEIKDEEITSWVAANEGQAKTIDHLIEALTKIRNLDWGTDHCDAKNMIADEVLNKIKENK